MKTNRSNLWQYTMLTPVQIYIRADDEARSMVDQKIPVYDSICSGVQYRNAAHYYYNVGIFKQRLGVSKDFPVMLEYYPWLEQLPAAGSLCSRLIVHWLEVLC